MAAYILNFINKFWSISLFLSFYVLLFSQILITIFSINVSAIKKSAHFYKGISYSRQSGTLPPLTNTSKCFEHFDLYRNICHRSLPFFNRTFATFLLLNLFFWFIMSNEVLFLVVVGILKRLEFYF